MLIVVSLECVGEVFSSVVCCIIRFGAGARIDDGDVEQLCLVLASGAVAEEYSRLRCHIHP